jgi:sigma-B regulation protein RsbU (phosphoserine phosphatase)
MLLEELQDFSYLTEMKEHKVRVLLVDDQEMIAESVRRMLSDEEDIEFFYCQDPSDALEKANEVKPTVILQDLIMPEIDGLTLIRYFRANAETEKIPMIVLSSKEEAETKAEAFALGANDYMVKFPDRLEVLARIRYHSKGYIRLLQRNEAYEKLAESQRLLKAELNDAAKYALSLLPKKEDGKIFADWEYIPSTDLAGDSLGYNWLDEDHFSIYLLDVCGHGVGAALHSISAINVIRSQTLPKTDFYDPGSVLTSLNNAFLSDDHDGMFFTMWYGVYHLKTRELVYSSGGHPPSILVHGSSLDQMETVQLATPSFIVGGMKDMKYETKSINVEKYAKLFVYSDGVFELEKEDGVMYTVEELALEMAKEKDSKQTEIERIVKISLDLNGPGALPDDLSLIHIDFGES